MSATSTDALPGELIVAVLAEQGYQLRDDDTSPGRVGFVTHRYGIGHWEPPIWDSDFAKWVWDSDDHELINVELPEGWFR